MKTREQAMVPRAEFSSYYGRQVLKSPVWKVPDVPLYFFLGGMAGAAAPMAVLADASGRRRLAEVNRAIAAGGALASVVALIHDLGRPTRFLNMLRVFRPTSPLSVGSWILAPFSAAATGAMVSRWATAYGPVGSSRLGGVLRPAGALAGGASAVVGPALCSYTAVLVSDTAIPAWHEAYRELPFVFGGGGLASAGGAGLLLAPLAEQGPARRATVVGAGVELAAMARLERRGDLETEPYGTGRAGRLLRTARILTGSGAALSAAAGVAQHLAQAGVGPRRGAPGGPTVRRVRTACRVASAVGGAAVLAGGLCTRFGVFAAGMQSSENPEYVVTPQRDRLNSGTPARLQ